MLRSPTRIIGLSWLRWPANQPAISSTKRQLVRELAHWLSGSGIVAPRRHVDVVQLDAAFACPLEYDVQVASDRLCPHEPSLRMEVTSGTCGTATGDAVIALLPADGDMRIACVAERFIGKICVRALRLLEAQHVRLVPAQITHDEIDAQAHRVDVPRGDGKWSRRPSPMHGRATFPACERRAQERSRVFPSRRAAVTACGCPARLQQLLVHVAQRRVWLRTEVDVEQGHHGLKPLRVDHRPLLQRESLGLEHQRDLCRATEDGLVLDLDRRRVFFDVDTLTLVSLARSIVSASRNFSGVCAMK